MALSTVFGLLLLMVAFQRRYIQENLHDGDGAALAPGRRSCRWHYRHCPGLIFALVITVLPTFLLVPARSKLLASSILPNLDLRKLARRLSDPVFRSLWNTWPSVWVRIHRHIVYSLIATL
jgi:hypothetical protein